MTRALPPSASIAHLQADGILFAPSAERNVGPLRNLLAELAPRSGKALEIASGTGQHVTAFAQAMPDILWQPTEIDAARRVSIDAHVAKARLNNVLPALLLDAASDGWGLEQSGNDMILLSNLLHLITEKEARTIITEAAQALTATGLLILYGPFKRAGKLTSEGDIRFDSELRGADPLIGYKNDLDITSWLNHAGLIDNRTTDMPANNLAFIAGKPRP